MTYLGVCAQSTSTGRARNPEFLRSPESMFPYCFRILSPLLILWQLILPCSAPWLHNCFEDVCAEACGQSLGKVGSPQREETVKGNHSCSCRFHQADEKPSDHSDQSAPAKKPHDCSSCAVCQALAAPRTLASMVVLAFTEQTVCSIVNPDCADPLLGFGLPPQCRAPPVCERG